MQRVHNWLSQKCQPIKSETHGMGEFAIAPIPRGEVIAIFGGSVTTRKERDALPEDVRYLQLGVDQDFFIGPVSTTARDAADWFNHSCEPNAGLRGQIKLVAMRDIAKGEEITLDYCMCAAQTGPERTLFECTCGKPSCRQKITNHDWENPHLQQKYRGYFSEYIEDLITDKP